MNKWSEVKGANFNRFLKKEEAEVKKRVVILWVVVFQIAVFALSQTCSSRELKRRAYLGVYGTAIADSVADIYAVDSGPNLPPIPEWVATFTGIHIVCVNALCPRIITVRENESVN